MEQMKHKEYKPNLRRTEWAEKILLPLILLLYPLLLVNQGIDITDTTYSLGYYRFMDRMDLTWVLATYLANLTGSFLMRLPLGDTLLGMNLYTGLIPGALALICYYALKKRLPVIAVFAGEIIALSLCWCPTAILYNYLTYFLFTSGSLFLYRGMIKDRRRDFVFSGICLGLNVMVRFPNVLEASLILAVWFAGRLSGDRMQEVAKRTGYCILGYLLGLGGLLLSVAIRYGAGAFPAMVGGLLGMTEEASDYTFSGMLSDIGSAYGTGLRWMAYMLPCILAGVLLFSVKKGKWEKGKKAVFLLGIPVLLRLYWGHGMFTFRYYDYECVFQWMMLFLILTLLLCIADISGCLSKERDTRCFAFLILVLVVITPFGSNNYTWQNMNNLFLAAPYTLWACYRFLCRTKDRAAVFPLRAFAVTVLLMVFVQGLGFHLQYVFRDGVTGEKRNCAVENSRVLRGMYTTQENGENLSELIAFCNISGIAGTDGASAKGEKGADTQAALFWGDAPGLSYILNVPSAIFTTWPEIPSSTYTALEEALSGLSFRPTVILHNETGKEIVPGDKTDLIFDFLAAHRYRCVFANGNYKVYKATEENGDDRF